MFGRRSDPSAKKDILEKSDEITSEDQQTSGDKPKPRRSRESRKAQLAELKASRWVAPTVLALSMLFSALLWWLKSFWQ